MVLKKESHKHFWPIITIMMFVGVITCLASIGILYKSAVEAAESRLVSLVSSKARLINSVAVFDAEYSRVDHPDGAEGATLSQIRNSFKDKNGFGETGEFVVGQLRGESIEFLMSSRQLEQAPNPIPLSESAAEPMRRALNNGAGTVVGLDYENREVIAAYQLVPQLSIGLVAKIDMAEVQKPFISASINALIIALIIIVMGTLLISQIEEEEHSSSEAFALKSGVGPKEWLIYRILLLATVALTVMMTSIGLLYHSEREAENQRLLDMVETQASLINAVAEFDAQYNEDDFPGGSVKATLLQVSNSMQESPGFGVTGEFLLGGFDGYSVKFLTQPSHALEPVPAFHVVELHSNAMKQALAGRTGTLVDIDYRNENVLAAFTPLPALEAGLVAKIDIPEIRSTFFQASFKTSAVAAVAICFGALLLWQLSGYKKDQELPDLGQPISHGLAISDEARVSPVLLLFTLSLGIALFVLDLALPLGIACGLPYIFFVLVGKIYPRREHTLFLAFLATILIFIGYFYSPVGGQDWVVITNRVLAVAAIWLTALTVSVSQAQNRAQKVQASELRRLSLAVENSPASVIITDPDGIIQYVNQRYTELTGYSREESVGRKSNMTRSGNTPDPIYSQLWESLNSGQTWQGEFHNKKKSGELYWERASIHPIISAKGKVVNFVALQEDITERKVSELKLQYMATHDNLTNLPTRRLCMDRLAKIIDIAKRKQMQAAVLFIDLDGFKEVNDSFGHDVGDQVLIDTATRLKACVRESDTVARIGGDEFIILLSEINKQQDAAFVAKKVLENIKQPYNIEQKKIDIGVSIGIAIYPNNAVNTERLIQCADKAMYSVKTSGKNHYSFAE
ncbi:diguanylate cyclase domain-containing protein [Neptuniibacter sp. QD34_54]|uniref:diguanylate cyclase domain-containing protein n=1 Tax=Neptuniibacter sp. QD34_54 TaxID=3398208 RepID=UPI0039F49C77